MVKETANGRSGVRELLVFGSLCSLFLNQNVFISFFFLQSTKAEKVIQLKCVKCYLGLKKKLKPPTR